MTGATSDWLAGIPFHIANNSYTTYQTRHVPLSSYTCQNVCRDGKRRFSDTYPIM